MAAPGATLDKVFAAEAAIAWIRVAVIALNSVTYALFMDHAGTTEWLAYSIVVTANAYGLGVVAFKPYRRYPVLLSSYFTTFVDAAFITLWLGATGGWESPFYLLWLLSVTAVAFRFGLRPALFAGGVYTVSYATLLFVMGEFEANLAQFVLRMGYVFLTGALGGLISREVDVQAREKNTYRGLAEALRESEERFRGLSDMTSEGIAIHENGRVLVANRAFARMFGWSPEDIVGRHAAELIDPVSLPLLAERLVHPTDEPYEILARRKDGSNFHAQIAARGATWEGREVRVVIVEDVSEKKRAEKAVREREILAMQNERLREMDGIKSRFINNAAHELGTPLTPIKLQAHLLRLGNLGELNDKQRQAVEVLSRNVDHLGSMVKELLDASRVQSQNVVLKTSRTDAHALLLDAATTFRGAGARGIDLRVACEPGLHVEADPGRLSQAIYAMLDNAIRFTPAGGKVTLTGRREGDRVLLSVSDTGAGIAAADIPKLFEPFVQIHDTMQESRSGAGLGLYIARGLVEAHGGRIRAESAGRGKGSTFHVSLPAA